MAKASNSRQRDLGSILGCTESDLLTFYAIFSKFSIFDRKFYHARTVGFWKFSNMLTLIRLTSKRPCQDREGAPGAPPIYLGSGANFCSKIMFPQKLASIPTHLAPFQNIFSKNHKKIGKNWKSIKKLLKMSENSKICNF